MKANSLKVTSMVKVFLYEKLSKVIGIYYYEDGTKYKGEWNKSTISGHGI